MKHWLASMQNTFAAMIAQLFASILHFILCYTFLFYFEMDVRGLGLATSLTNLFKIIVICSYSYCSGSINQALIRPTTKDVFSSWGEYLKLAIPAMVILSSEWWAYEIVTMLAGLLGTTEQASQTIVTTANSIFFEIPLGTAEASCALIGYCIGSGNVALARRFFRLTATIACCEAICLSTLIFLGSHQIASFYSIDEDV